MKTTMPSGRPDIGADADALIKEARRRQRRRYIVTGLAIVVVLAGVAGGTVAAHGSGGHHPGQHGLRRTVVASGRSTSSPGAPARGARPRFFADIVTTGEGNGALQVRASATGVLVAEEKGQGTSSGVAGLAATGPGSFVIAEPESGRCETRLYRVQLDGQGQPGRMAPLGSALRGQVWSLAASAGGHLIGYAVSGCGAGGPGYIGVLDPRTGRSRAWGDVSLGGESTGNVAMTGPLSMSASGRLLAFTGADSASNGRSTSQGVRILATDAAPGTVARRSRVVLSRPVAQPALAAVSLSPSGASLYLCAQSENSLRRIVTTVTEYATASMQPQHVLATVTGILSTASCPMAIDTSVPAGSLLARLRSPPADESCPDRRSNQGDHDRERQHADPGDGHHYRSERRLVTEVSPGPPRALVTSRARPSRPGDCGR